MSDARVGGRVGAPGCVRSSTPRASALGDALHLVPVALSSALHDRVGVEGHAVAAEVVEDVPVLVGRDEKLHLLVRVGPGVEPEDGHVAEVGELVADPNMYGWRTRPCFGSTAKLATSVRVRLTCSCGVELVDRSACRARRRSRGSGPCTACASGSLGLPVHPGRARARPEETVLVVVRAVVVAADGAAEDAAEAVERLHVVDARAARRCRPTASRTSCSSRRRRGPRSRSASPPCRTSRCRSCPGCGRPGSP